MAEPIKGQNRDKNQENRSQDKQRTLPENDITSANNDHQNAASNRGGTTDMGADNTLRHATGNTTRANRGSGITIKRSVTGSDYDGQVSEG